MKIEEMECKFSEEKLLSVIDKGALKRYVKPINEEQVMSIDSYGIIRCNDGTFETYITDSEKGVSYFGSNYKLEEEACEKLYRYIYICDILNKKELELMK